MNATNGHVIDWRKAHRLIKNLRRRIFRAAREGNLAKVRSLQKLLLRRWSATSKLITDCENPGKVRQRLEPL